jgi:uncharacterized protein (DUF934 family)
MPPREALSLPSPSTRMPSGHRRNGSAHSEPEGVRGEGRGEGQPKAPAERVSAAHPNPLATEVGRGDRVAPAATGEPNPNGPIWRGGAFHKDAWVAAPESEPLPEVPVIFAKPQWLARRDRLAGHRAPLGLRIEPGETVDDIAADLPRFALIALSFPKFSDGRAFSAARLLREKHGFEGELRAVGNVLVDQIPFMRRVGFDSYEVTNAPTRRALVEGRIADVTLHYQPTGIAEPPAGTRPWLRRTRA